MELGRAICFKRVYEAGKAESRKAAGILAGSKVTTFRSDTPQ